MTGSPIAELRVFPVRHGNFSSWFEFSAKGGTVVQMFLIVQRNSRAPMGQVSSVAYSDSAAVPTPREEEGWRDQAGREAVGEPGCHPCPCQPAPDVLLWAASLGLLEFQRPKRPWSFQDCCCRDRRHQNTLPGLSDSPSAVGLLRAEQQIPTPQQHCTISTSSALYKYAIEHLSNGKGIFSPPLN